MGALIKPSQLEIIRSYKNNGLLRNEDITPELLESATHLRLKSYYKKTLPFLVGKCVDYLMINICAENVFSILCSAYWTKERRLANAAWEFIVKNKDKIGSEDLQWLEWGWKQCLYASNDYHAVCELSDYVQNRIRRHRSGFSYFR